MGAGVTGLAAASFLGGSDFLVLEADSEIGGYCKTVRQEGFVWDYSGHFFHFAHPELEQWLRERMPGQRIRTVRKKAFIDYGGRWIDFPFQKNIHQLPQPEFIDCLYDLSQARGGEAGDFKAWLSGRLGRSICEKFLIPYNEKLYACDLATLDVDAMGRFFPKADLDSVLRNMKAPDNGGYNATFTYPEGGAIEYVRAIARHIPPEQISLDEPLERVDLKARIARTPQREIAYRRLISTLPLNRLLALADLPHDPSIFSWNKVLVFNLGFDRKGPRDVHWLYVPDRARSYYRVGFYDNIFETDRMSLYVELGFPKDAQVDIAHWRSRVLDDLRAQGLVGDHQLVAEHSVILDPAYVHITQRSNAEVERVRALLATENAVSIGRYGAWTYCSIEDNLIEARRVALGMARAPG